MSDLDIQISNDDTFTVVKVHEAGALIARYSFENELLLPVLSALSEHLGFAADDLVYFFPLCDGCVSEARCLERGSCFFEDATDCEA